MLTSPWSVRVVLAALLLALPLACASSPSPDRAPAEPSCTRDDDCPTPAAPCLAPACHAGRCASTPSPAGPAPGLPIEGDCKQSACDGQGHLISTTDSGDLPEDDDQTCTVEICAGDVPEHRPRPVGISCAPNRVCSAVGTCVACVAPQKRCGEGFLDACSAQGEWTHEAMCSGTCQGANCRPLVEITLGDHHACGRFADGSIACWGNNMDGQLGHSNEPVKGPDPETPSLVPGLRDVKEIAVGDEHVCALRHDGSVRCWGSNDFGQLGDGTNKARATPVAPAGLSGKVIQIAAGGYHTCALLDDGSARCWGENDEGQLGDGSVDNPKGSTGFPLMLMAAAPEGPAAVHGLPPATTIRSRGDHTCVLDAAGAVACWGSSSGMGRQVDHPEKRGKRRPVPVRDLHDATALSLGTDHSCARLRDKRVMCWGGNGAGQLGDGTTTGQTSPQVINGLDNVEEIAAGGHFTCARRSDGTVSCWGRNDFGQLGDGTTQKRGGPTLVPTLRDVKGLRASANAACATLATGAVVCWGETSLGELGKQSNTPIVTPTPLSLAAIRP